MASDKKRVVSLLYKSAELYQKNLLGRNLLFIYSLGGRKTESLEVTFYAQNFEHLTGVRAAKGIPSSQFFNLCISKRLAQTDFELSKNGSHWQKLNVIPLLFKPNLSARMLGEAQEGLHIHLMTDKLAGNERLCMGFAWREREGKYCPNTALDSDVRIEVNKPRRILLTYRKWILDTYYSERVYAARNVDWSEIDLPQEYSYLPLPGKEPVTV